MSSPLLYYAKRLVFKFRSIFHTTISFFILKSSAEVKFYIIRRDWSGCGFFSNWFYVICHIVEAMERGLHPIVEMDKYKTQYDVGQRCCHIKNTWYRFFNGHGYQRNLRLGNYIYSPMRHEVKNMPISIRNGELYIDQIKLVKFHRAIQQFAQLDESLERETKSAFGNVKRPVIGLHFRGTDKIAINQKKYKNHAQSLPLHHYIDATKALVNKLGAETILVCTDDKDAYEILCSSFDVPIISNLFERTSGSVGLHNKTYDTGTSRNIDLAREVLIDACMLAKCDGLVLGNSNVSHAAIIMSAISLDRVVYLDGLRF